MIWLLCFLLSCGSAPESQTGLADDVVIDPTQLPTLTESEPVDTTGVEAIEQRVAVEDLKYQVAGLEWYIHDKKLQEAGHAPPGWELPDLEVYKREPWCHIPKEVHGNHKTSLEVLGLTSEPESLPPRIR